MGIPDYTWWIDYKSLWELKQAANLYLGFNPDNGGTFDAVDDLLEKYDRGLILTDSETLWTVGALKSHDSKIEWDDVFDKENNCRISLTCFINEKIQTGEINYISINDGPPDGIYFRPVEIVSFFLEHFLNKPPQALLSALGIKKKKNSKSFSSSGDQTAHAVAYKIYHDKQIALYMEEKIPKPWKAQDKEELILSQEMGDKFNRVRFRKARKEILASYPNSGKTRLSVDDHIYLKSFISKKNMGF